MSIKKGRGQMKHILLLVPDDIESVVHEALGKYIVYSDKVEPVVLSEADQIKQKLTQGTPTAPPKPKQKARIYEDIDGLNAITVLKGQSSGRQGKSIG